MDKLMTPLYALFGYILRFCYWLCGNNFFLALVVFTVIVKLLMLPMSLSQQKSSAKLQKMKPEMDKLRQQYGTNQQKYSEELQKLYNKYDYKMSAGCLPLLIQFPIIFGMYGVIYKPVTYMLGYSAEGIKRAAEAVLAKGIDVGKPALEAMNRLAGVAETTAAARTDEIYLARWMENGIDFKLFGKIDLSATPTIKWGADFSWWLLLIPLFILISQIVSTLLTMKINGQQTDGMSKGMIFGMPFISVIFSFSFPAAIGFYWILQSVFQVGVSYLAKKLYSPERDERREARKREKERAEKLERLRRLHGGEDDVPANRALGGIAIKDDPDATVPEEPETPKLTKKQQKKLDRQRLNESRNNQKES